MLPDLSIGIVDVVTRRFVSDQGSATPNTPGVPVTNRADTQHTAEWLVGVTDGDAWGWWGPLFASSATHARQLFHAVGDHTPASPDEWARRFRRSTRHAHTGVLGIAVGALELATWDLLGHRNARPVWALLVDTPLDVRTQTYATCFGIDVDGIEAGGFAAEIARRWPVQKWQPPQCVTSVAGLARVCRRAGGTDHVALDFQGKWHQRDVLTLAKKLGGKLAWLEEPYAPGELHAADRGSLPAPHAAGEHCYGPDETAALRYAGVEVWQPDAVFCGGFGNLLRIAALAAEADARCLPHGGGFLPAIHAAAVTNNIEMVEYHVLLEPSRQRHLDFPVVPDSRGLVEVPRTPGWGGQLSPTLELYGDD